MKKLGMLLIISLGFVACTKKAPYKEEFKEQVLSKSMVGTSPGEDYLYTASVLEMSRTADDGRPFWFGDNKRVQLEWTENSLKVIERERDQRFAKPTNDRMVIEIPVEHLDYECAKNAFDECTSSETTKNDVNWSQKKSFKFRPQDAKQGALEVLPIVLDQAFGSPCFKELSSELKDYDISENHMNFKVERRYMQLCGGAWDSVSEVGLTGTSITAIFNYSLVKTKSVLSPDFKTVVYPDTDKDTFGFFATETKFRDVDNNLVDGNLRRVMNHWNPNRKSIDFYLSEEFNKPQHKKLKELSYQTVDKLNEGLEKSGAQFRVKLNDPVKGMNPGDIRNSMIVLVEDPFQGGPLGYGPQTEDPVTGEIISARTIMYLSGFEQYAKISYGDIAQAIQRQKAKQAAKAVVLAPEMAAEAQKAEEKQAAMVQTAKKSVAKTKAKPMVAEMKVTAANLAKAEKSIKNYKQNRNDDYSKNDLKSYAKYLQEAKNCTFTIDPSAGLTEINPELMQTIIDKFSNSDDSGLIPWKDLSGKQKREVVDLLIAQVYQPTLLHELGHNLGLRHNFQGSEDKANFYDPKNEEDAQVLAAAGIKHEIPYSTVMEYGDDLRSLPILGKYDIAALRFAYAGKVKLADGNLVDLKVDEAGNRETLEKLTKVDGLKLADYGYCTDESVGPNAGCRRFDEGTNYVEIADYLISSYKERYTARATRDGRDDFSVIDDLSYAQRTYARFIDMRSINESFERIRNQFGLEQDDPIIDQIPWLKELREATYKINRFYLEVLQTPDLHCLLAKKDNPSAIVAAQPLNSISATDISCSKVDISSSPYLVVGEYGRLHNSAKDPDSTNPYIDQIDARGYWLDRWAAAKALFDRNLGQTSFNRYFENGWDLKEIRPEIEATVTGLIQNDVSPKVEVRLFDGTTAVMTVPSDYHKSGVVKQMFHPVLSKAMGIEHGDNYFSGILSQAIQKVAIPTLVGPVESGTELFDLVSASRVDRLNPIGDFETFTTVDPGGPYLVLASAKNKIAKKLMGEVNVQKELASLSDGDLLKVAQVLEAGVVTAETLKEKVPTLTDRQLEYLAKISKEDPVAAQSLVGNMVEKQLMAISDLARILMGLTR